MAKAYKSGWTSWKARAIKRRDWKQDASQPDRGHAPTKKKDTKRWCRGKKGKEHTWVSETVTLLRTTYTRARCTVCGKERWGV